MRRKNLNMFGTKERPRLVIFRSHKYIYGQLIDDENHKVVLSHSNVGKKQAKNDKKVKPKVDASREVGKTLASLAAKKKIKEVVFDRNGYIYHGRVKAFADGAREGGLKF